MAAALDRPVLGNSSSAPGTLAPLRHSGHNGQLSQSMSTGLLGRRAAAVGPLKQSTSASLLGGPSTGLVGKFLAASSSAGSLQQSMAKSMSLTSFMSAGTDSGVQAAAPPQSTQPVHDVAAGIARPREPIWIIEQMIDFGEPGLTEETFREDTGLESQLWRAICSIPGIGGLFADQDDGYFVACCSTQGK